MFYILALCSGLTSLIIPENVVNIGEAAFWNCKGLTSIIISETVTDIGDLAFYGCASLRDIKSCVTNPFDVRIFERQTKETATLYVPIGTLELYKAKDGWKEFKTIKEFDPGDDSAVESPTIKGSTIGYYDLNGRSLDKMHRGLKIIKRNDGTTRKAIEK